MRVDPTFSAVHVPSFPPPRSRARPSRWPLVRPPLAAAVLVLLAGGAGAQAQEPLQLRATPMLAEQLPQGAPPPSFISGDRITGRTELETVIEGDAELRRPGLSLRADQLRHDQSTDIATARRGARECARRPLHRHRGPLQIDAFEGFFLQPSYRFLATGAHGSAERVELHDADRATVLQGTYTTCRIDQPDALPDWILRAERLELDQESDEGYAEGAVLEFKGVPILPVPAISFPLSDRRKSGWLPPTIGLDNKSGLDLSVPYYWNIAPNRDATFTPGLMLRRGADLSSEFRYLENNYHGQVLAHVMPSDRLRDRERWGLFARHSGNYDIQAGGIGGVGLGLNLNRVSDNDYWRDFSRKGLSLTTRLLASDGSLTWSRGDFALAARALKWQTLQDVNAPIIPPYDRLPQLTGRWSKINDRGFDYSIDADYTRFRADRFWTRQPNADRGVLHAQLSHPFTRPWGFLVPKAQLHATGYRFDGPLSNGANSASRVLPTLSLDSGLVFERPASYFGRAFTQTLEPRLMYVYTPYRDQSRLPNYDSGLYDFNFATIWSENAFAGHDRIVDNNLVTAGLTTRLLDPDSGAEVVRWARAALPLLGPAGGAAGRHADRGRLVGHHAGRLDRLGPALVLRHRGAVQPRHQALDPHHHPGALDAGTIPHPERGLPPPARPEKRTPRRRLAVAAGRSRRRPLRTRHHALGQRWRQLQRPLVQRRPAQLQSARQQGGRRHPGSRIRCRLLDRACRVRATAQLDQLGHPAHHVPAGTGRPVAPGQQPAEYAAQPHSALSISAAGSHAAEPLHDV